jgi:hypothetical protein
MSGTLSSSHPGHQILAAPRSNNELDMAKLLAHFPDTLNIKESLIKHVFEPAMRTGLKPSDVQDRRA